VLIVDSPGSSDSSPADALQSSDVAVSFAAARLSSSWNRFVIATVRPRPSFATGPQFGRLCPTVPPTALRASPALSTTSMKSGRWNATVRALYGAPASFASAASISPLIGSSLRCHVSESWLIRAKLTWNPPLWLHGSPYVSSGPIRRYHLEFSTVIFAHASSAGSHLLSRNACAAAPRYVLNAASPGLLIASAAARSSRLTASISAL
jgi:hypothetical protein